MADEQPNEPPEPPQKPRMGRPPVWTPDLKAKAQDEICNRLANGESLNRITKDDHMPSYNTVWEWTKEKSLGQSLDESGNPVGEKIASNFAERFARARDQQAEFFADDCIRIADGASDRDSAAAARIQIDVRMKRAAQMKPRVFGERSIVDQNVSINVTMTEEKRLELIERRRLLLEDEDRESPNA